MKAGWCPKCDRENCRAIPGWDPETCCDGYFLGGGEHRCKNCKASDDCEARAVNWRERCLKAEAKLDAMSRSKEK